VDLSVIYGLASALSYGAGDYLSQIAGRAVGVWRTSFYYYVFGLAALSIWLLLRPNVSHRAQGAPLVAWAAAIGSGLPLLAAGVLFTQGLIKGRIAIVAPITASYGAVTTLLSFATGERLSSHAALGIALTIGGACIVTVPASRSSSLEASSGAGWAIGAAFAYSVGFWLQGEFVVPVLGPVLPIWVVYASGVAVMGILQITRIVSLALPQPTSRLFPTLSAAVLSTLGFLALTLGLSTGRIAVVVVLSSLTSAITVLLARLFNGTRLGWHQWSAIALIIFGLVLIRA
jgi:drug/metabolite transporter (DMT)-like permease